MLSYRYEMGMTINGTPIPDPSSWTYQVSDLDTSGKRDATGLLHRAWVAQKLNYQFTWSALDWNMLQTVLSAVNTPQFRLIAPDPRTYNGTHSGNYYCGDRTGKTHYYLGERDGIAMFELKMNLIEY